jgi:hypothetical protein
MCWSSTRVICVEPYQRMSCISIIGIRIDHWVNARLPGLKNSVYADIVGGRDAANRGLAPKARHARVHSALCGKLHQYQRPPRSHGPGSERPQHSASAGSSSQGVAELHGTTLPPPQQIAAKPTKRDSAERRQLTVMFCDWWVLRRCRRGWIPRTYGGLSMPITGAARSWLSATAASSPSTWVTVFSPISATPSA